MDAGRIDGMHFVDAGNNRRDNRSGKLVNERAEAGVFLRRPADDRERPDRVGPMKDLVDDEHREVVNPRVIAEMIAERSFGKRTTRVNRAGDDKIRRGMDRRSGRLRNQRNATPAKRTRE
jgi:hypothetical protein